MPNTTQCFMICFIVASSNFPIPRSATSCSTQSTVIRPALSFEQIGKILIHTYTVYLLTNSATTTVCSITKTVSVTPFAKDDPNQSTRDTDDNSRTSSSELLSPAPSSVSDVQRNSVCRQLRHQHAAASDTGTRNSTSISALNQSRRIHAPRLQRRRHPSSLL